MIGLAVPNRRKTNQPVILIAAVWLNTALQLFEVSRMYPAIYTPTNPAQNNESDYDSCLVLRGSNA